ncbi:unnamed protein product [Phaeothamnion confervicola]
MLNFLFLTHPRFVLTFSLQQCREFDERGFLALPAFWTPDEVAEGKARIAEIIETLNLDESRTVFTTKEQTRQADEYFLGSGDKIRFFWEEGALDEHGEFRQPRLRCINKIGHALHDLDPVFRARSYDPRLGKVRRSVSARISASENRLSARACIYSSSRGSAGRSARIRTGRSSTRSRSRWWECGGRWRTARSIMAASGPCPDPTRSACVARTRIRSSLDGVTRRFKRNAAGTGCEFDGTAPEWDLNGAVSLEVNAGTLVLLHSSVVHYSGENRSEKSRHAYSIHVIEGEAGCVYPADNWLQRQDGVPFNPLP